MRRTLAIALALVALVVAPMARADAPTQQGWWWSGHLSQLPLSPPSPDVPTGGLYVAGGLSGASGVSALRFELPAGANAPVLTLRIAKTSGTIVLGACRVAGPWQAAEAGAWDKRPMPACDKGTVAAEIASEGGHAIARLTLAPLVDGDVLDVVLLPGKDPATGADATFDVSFDPPGPDALAVTSTPAPASGDQTSTTPTTAGTVPAPSSGTLAAPTPSPVAPPPGAPSFTPAANVGNATPTPAAVNSAPLVAGPASTSTPGDTDGRVVGLVLGLLVAAVWFLTTRTGIGAELSALSGGATNDIRGIGRFAAPRATSPPTL